MELRTKRRKIFFITALGLFALGLWILQIGLVILHEDSQKEIGKNLEKKITEFELNKPISWITEPPIEANAPFKKIKINFDSDIIFVGDKTGVRVNVDVTDSNLLAMFFIPTKPDEDFSKKSAKELNEIINKSAEYGKIIEVTSLTDPPFETKVEMPFDREGEIAFQVILLNKDYAYTGTPNTGTVITVYPRIDKLTAETNQAILRQTEHDNITAEVQNRKTDVIIGISWIAVSLIPLVVAGDILIQLFIKPPDITKLEQKSIVKKS